MSLAHDLLHYTGTENFYRHWTFRNCTYTDGVRHMARTAGAYWLIDVICSYVPQCQRAGDNFYSAMLQKQEDGTWMFYLSSDYSDLKIEQEIPYSDFPINEIKFFVAYNGGDLGWTIMLPQEY